MIIASSTASDKPMEIKTKVLGMAVALTDQAGAKLDAGFAKLEIDSAPSISVPLQVY